MNIILGKKTGGEHRQQHITLKEYVRSRDNHTCQICGRPGEQVDHIIPWAISHDSSLGNLRILCLPCNLAHRRRRRDARPDAILWWQQIEDEYKEGGGLVEKYYSVTVKWGAIPQVDHQEILKSFPQNTILANLPFDTGDHLTYYVPIINHVVAVSAKEPNAPTLQIDCIRYTRFHGGWLRTN